MVTVLEAPPELAVMCSRRQSGVNSEIGTEITKSRGAEPVGMGMLKVSVLRYPLKLVNLPELASAPGTFLKA